MLGKGDFKSLLKWRLKMRELCPDAQAKAQGKAAAGGGGQEEGEKGGDKPKAVAPKSAVEEEVRALFSL